VLKLLLIRDALTGATSFIGSHRVNTAVAESGSHDGAVVDVLVEIVAVATHRF
jgi:hypothetical protein